MHKEGENLATVLAQKGPLNTTEIWQVLSNLLPVIQEIHAGGVIYGDIKPEHVLVDSYQLTVLQYSRAKEQVEQSKKPGRSPSGFISGFISGIAGSPAYAAPEQLRGKPVFASDLYSLGVTCIHLLTGVHPFSLFDSGGHLSSWRDYLLKDSNSQKQLEQQQLAQFLDRLIAPDLQTRFSTALEAITDLQKLQGRQNPLLIPMLPKSPTWKCYATLVGHEGLFASINAVAISLPNSAANPDAKAPPSLILASASDDQTIRLWDLETGQEGLVLRGHTKSVGAIAFHPSRNILASGSADRTINLWDPQTGDIIKTLRYHKQAVKAVSFSPNGEILASGGADKTVQLWNFPTEEILASLPGHRLAITALAFSPSSLEAYNHQILVSASQDATIKVWNLRTLSLLCTLKAHTGSVRAIAFSPDGRWLATAGEDRTIKLWDGRSWECIRTLSGHPWEVSALAFSSDGKILFSGSWDKTIKLWEVDTGRELEILAGHTDSVSCLAISKNIMASGSKDKTIKLWRLIPEN